MELGDLDTATRLCRESLARPGLARRDRGVAARAARRCCTCGRGRRPRRSRRSPRPSRCSRRCPPTGPARLGNRGDVYLHQRRVLGRRRRLPRGRRRLRRRRACEVEQAKAEHNLGYALMVGGDLIGALEAMSAAYPVLAPVSPVHRAVCTQDRAEVLLAMGLDDEGAELLRRAARDYGLRAAAPAPGRGRARAGPRPGRQRPGVRAPAGRVARGTGSHDWATTPGGLGPRPWWWPRTSAWTGTRRPSSAGPPSWRSRCATRGWAPRRPRPGSTARAC